MEIKTRRLLLRPWRMEDAASVFRFANNPKIAENLRDVFPWPYQKKDAEEFLRGCVAADEKRALFRAIEVDGQAVGSIALTRGEDVYGRSAELGYWLAEEFWGQGIMPRAVEQLCREGFARWDIVRICAEPYRGNTASRRVLEKAGFTLEGVMRQGVYKNGRLQDYCMYALLRPSEVQERVLSLRNCPERLEMFISYFQEKWADEYSGAMYRDCLTHTPGAPGPLPQWYLLCRGETVLGCAGLIPNDFISRADLWPWLCALYVEPEVRGKGMGGVLIRHVEEECRRLGFPRLYLTTDLRGYYERYGYSFLGPGYGPDGGESRIYGRELKKDETP